MRKIGGLKFYQLKQTLKVDSLEHELVWFLSLLFKAFCSIEFPDIAIYPLQASLVMLISYNILI